MACIAYLSDKKWVVFDPTVFILVKLDHVHQVLMLWISMDKVLYVHIQGVQNQRWYGKYVVDKNSSLKWLPSWPLEETEREMEATTNNKNPLLMNKKICSYVLSKTVFFSIKVKFARYK